MLCLYLCGNEDDSKAEEIYGILLSLLLLFSLLLLLVIFRLVVKISAIDFLVRSKVFAAYLRGCLNACVRDNEHNDDDVDGDDDNDDRQPLCLPLYSFLCLVPLLCYTLYPIQPLRKLGVELVRSNTLALL